MQARMKKYPLSEGRINELLEKEPVGRLATIGVDGCPYITPVHFVYLDGIIYIHGLAAGQKLANIRENPLVGFEVDAMLSLLHGDQPCDTNTEYESVIIKGRASTVEDMAGKTAALNAIVSKYTPLHMGKTYPETMLKMTAVIAIAVDSCTGKYYPAG